MKIIIILDTFNHFLQNIDNGISVENAQLLQTFFGT